MCFASGAELREITGPRSNLQQRKHLQIPDVGRKKKKKKENTNFREIPGLEPLTMFTTCFYPQLGRRFTVLLVSLIEVKQSQTEAQFPQ